MSFSFYIKHKIKVILAKLLNFFKNDFKKEVKNSLSNRYFHFFVWLMFFLAIFIFTNYYFEIYTVEGESMSPNFENGNIVLLEKITPNLVNIFPSIKRGDAIVFTDVRNQEKRDTPPKLLKRVFGLPGESISVNDGKTKILGKDGVIYFVDPNYKLQVDSDPVMGTTTLLGPLDYYVLGDNRRNSRDSRNFGTVQPSEILGKVIYKIR